MSPSSKVSPSFVVRVSFCTRHAYAEIWFSVGLYSTVQPFTEKGVDDEEVDEEEEDDVEEEDVEEEGVVADAGVAFCWGVVVY